MNYNDKMLLLRPFTNFNYDLRRNLDKTLTPSQKRQVSIYYDKIYGDEGIARKRGYELKVYRPRSKKNLNAAKNAQNLKGLGQLKSVPFTVVDKQNARIRITKTGRLTVKEKGVTRTIELCNPTALVKDPIKEIKRLTDRHNKKSRYSVLSGNFEINTFVGDAVSIGNQVKLLTERYEETYQKWLRGIAVYHFNDQVDLIEYKKKINNAKRKKKRHGPKKNSRN